MTHKPTKNVAASVRQRLLNLRQSKGEDYQALLTQYAIERLLYRLSKSELSRRFILKGAMLFRVWSGQLHRPTKDVDLLGQGDPSPAVVAEAMRNILATPVPDDGLMFDVNTVVAEEIRQVQEYGGVRVKLTAKLGNARIPMQIDVGFGDVVTPAAKIRSYPTLLGQDAPRLRMYPLETVVAEKLEAVVMLGMANSRMKDYYDLLVIFRTYSLAEDKLAKAVAATFRRRANGIAPIRCRRACQMRLVADEMARRLWSEFRRRLGIDDASEDLIEVVQQVRSRAWPVMVEAEKGG